MRKIKNFDLNQSRYLSVEEMAELNGGVKPLEEKCTTDNIGKSCIYVGAEGLKFEGTCKYVYSYVYDGSSSTATVAYTCVLNP